MKNKIKSLKDIEQRQLEISTEINKLNKPAKLVAQYGERFLVSPKETYGQITSNLQSFEHKQVEDLIFIAGNIYKHPQLIRPLLSNIIAKGVKLFLTKKVLSKL